MSSDNTRQSSNLHLLFRQMLEIEYNDLDKYIGNSLAVLRNSENELEQKYQDLKSLVKPSEGQEEQGAELVHKFSHTTPFLLKHALFTSAYSFMEYSLKSFCEITVVQQGKHKSRLSKLEKVYQYYFFLCNEMELDKTRTEEDWKKLNIFKDLRNSIVHHNSTIGKSISRDTYEFIMEDKRILFEEPRGFSITDDTLILELTEVSRRFLFTLIEDYHTKYFSASLS